MDDSRMGFCTNLKVLNLGSYDMILGMDWLNILLSNYLIKILLEL